MEKLISDTLNSIKEYLPKLIKGVTDVIELLQNEEETKAIVLIGQIFEGLNWVVSAVNGLNNIGFEVIIAPSEINESLLKLESSLEIKDYIYTADIFEYEIKPILLKWLKSINDK